MPSDLISNGSLGWHPESHFSIWEDLKLEISVNDKVKIAWDKSMSIKRAYRHLSPIIGENSIEPLAAAVEVDRLRNTWMPDDVRVVLLAESHVWTSLEELKCRVYVPDQPVAGYARFVYCLGYGEPSVLGSNIATNHGTPQYWRLFHDCLLGPANSVHRLTRQEQNSGRRIQAKVDLLSQMRKAGLWLVDASVTALYHRGKKLVDGNNYDRALRISWDDHVGEKLRECSPTGVLIVGKAVANVLAGSVREVLPSASVNVISQPNAWLTKSAREAERRRTHDFCKPLLYFSTSATES